MIKPLVNQKKWTGLLAGTLRLVFRFGFEYLFLALKSCQASREMGSGTVNYDVPLKTVNGKDVVTVNKKVHKLTFNAVMATLHPSGFPP